MRREEEREKEKGGKKIKKTSLFHAFPSVLFSLFVLSSRKIFSKALSLILNLPLDWALQPSDPVMVSCFLSPVYTALGQIPRAGFFLFTAHPSTLPLAGS